MFSRISSIFSAMVLMAVLACMAQTNDTSFVARIGLNTHVIAQQAPYTYADTVGVTSANATFTGKIVCEIRSKKAGEIKIDTPTGTTILRGQGYDIWRVRVTKIYYTGTSDSLRLGSITVFGFPVAK